MASVFFLFRQGLHDLTILALLLGTATSTHALTFAEWQATVFSPAQLADPAISGRTANPDGDAFPNFLEYAFALHPFTPNANFEATSHSFGATTDGAPFLYTYVQRKDAIDLFYQFEYKNDLASPWHLLTDFADIAPPIDLGPVWQQTVTLPAHFSQVEFFRLRVYPLAEAPDPHAPPSLNVQLHDPFMDTDLRWTDRSNAETGYLIQRSIEGSGQWTNITTTPSDTIHFRDIHLGSATTYQYRARAPQKNGSHGNWSNLASITTPLDSDGDGLPDWFEIRIGTDPNNADSDGDGLSDGYEVRNGTRSYGYADIGNGLPEGTPGPEYDEDGNPIDGTTPITPGDPWFDPINGDADENGIPDGEEDWDEDGLTNNEEADLGTFPLSVEIVPRYAIIELRSQNPTNHVSYLGVTDTGILINQHGEIWKQGATSNLANLYVADVSFSGWAACNATPLYNVPSLKNLNDNTTRSLKVYTNAEAIAKARETNAEAGSTLEVKEKAGYVGAVSEGGIAVVGIWAFMDQTTTDAQGVTSITSISVGEDVYWDAAGDYHPIKTLYPSDYTGLDGTTDFTQINNQGTIIATLGEFNSTYPDGSPVIWDSLTDQPSIIPNTGYNFGLNERNERLETVTHSSNDARLIGTTTYDLGELFLGAMNEATARQPDEEGTMQTIPYTQIVGTTMDAGSYELSAVLAIKSIQEDSYVKVDLNNRVQLPSTPPSRLTFAHAISNTGLIYATSKETPPTGEPTSKDVLLTPFDVDTDDPLYSINKSPWIFPWEWGTRASNIGVSPDTEVTGNDQFSTMIEYVATEQEAKDAEEKAYKVALTVFNKDVRDANGEIQDFNIHFRFGDGTMDGISWTKENFIKTPGEGSHPEPPDLQNPDTPNATLANPTQGGVYRYDLNAFSKKTGIQIWLPTAGPDISSYWQSEIAYFKSTWGPAYRAKLNERALVFLLVSPPNYLAIKEAMKLKDISTLGPDLDWLNENGSGETIHGGATPCGLANIRPSTFSAGDRDRLTLHGYVIDFAKRNNMMYALIGREMGISELVLKNGPDIKDQLNKLFGFSNDTGTPDSPAALRSYEAGFDLHDGISLQTVMQSHGIKMQEPNGRSAKEWPSYETTTEGLKRKPQGAAKLQTLIQ